MPAHDMVIIDNGTLDALTANPSAVSQLNPILQPLIDAKKSARSGCKCKEPRLVSAAYTAAKNAILALTPEGRNTLKQFLNTRQARISIPTASKVNQHTI